MTVTANAGQGKVYGNADPALTYSNTSLGSGAALVGALNRAAGENVGSYAIGQGTLKSANNQNYSLTYVGDNFVVTQRPLSIIADSKTKLQGDANPLLTSTYSGFAPNEGPADLSGVLTLATPAANSSLAGNYPITLSGRSSGNYAISYVDGVLSVKSNGMAEPVRISIDDADRRRHQERAGVEVRDASTNTYRLIDGGIKLPEGAH